MRRVRAFEQTSLIYRARSLITFHRKCESINSNPHVFYVEFYKEKLLLINAQKS